MRKNNRVEIIVIGEYKLTAHTPTTLKKYLEDEYPLVGMISVETKEGFGFGGYSFDRLIERVKNNSRLTLTKMTFQLKNYKKFVLRRIGKNLVMELDKKDSDNGLVSKIKEFFNDHSLN